jgi:hypothetical protein
MQDSDKSLEAHKAMTKVIQSGQQNGTDTYCLKRRFSISMPSNFGFKGEWE